MKSQFGTIISEMVLLDSAKKSMCQQGSHFGRKTMYGIRFPQKGWIYRGTDELI